VASFFGTRCILYFGLACYLAQNSLHQFSRNFPVDGEAANLLRTWCLCCVLGTDLLRENCQTGAMGFGLIVRFSPVWQRLCFLFGCHGLLLPVMLLFDDASPYISSIMRGDASLARSAVSHDGSWIRVALGDSERSPSTENQF